MVEVEGLVATKLAGLASQCVTLADFGKATQMTELKLEEMANLVNGKRLNLTISVEHEK